MNYNDSKYDIPKVLTKISFSLIPVVGSAIAELINYLDAKYIEKRLLALECEVFRQNIYMDDFKAKLNDLDNDEHKYYVVRNNLKHLCLTALPETVDAFNKALIECIMKDTYDICEYATEIIKQLNADDILFLDTVKQFQLCADKETYQAKRDEAVKEIWKPGMKDRSVFFGESNTIFWKDYSNYLHLSEKVSDMGQLMNRECIAQAGENNHTPILAYAYIARSIIKLQSIGVLQCDYITTLGTASQNNIDRFHITFFGQKVLEYIDLDKGDKPNVDA